MVKYANDIVRDELNRREVEAGRPPCIIGHIGISRSFDTWELRDGQLHTIEPTQEQEDQVAAEILVAMDEIAKGNYEELDFKDSVHD